MQSLPWTDAKSHAEDFLISQFGEQDEDSAIKKWWKIAQL